MSKTHQADFYDLKHSETGASEADTLSAGDKTYVRNQIDWLRDLEVGPGELWTIGEVAISSEQLTALAGRGLLIRHPPRQGDTHRWQLKPGLRAFIDEVVEQTTFLPCGHRPFRNPRDREGYTCLHDECDATYTKAELREVRE